MLSDSHSPAKEGSPENACTDAAPHAPVADLHPELPSIVDPATCDPPPGRPVDPPSERSLAVVVASAASAPAPRFELDHAQPLNPHSFPNPPRKKGAGPPSTVANTSHLLKAYGITVRYDVIKKTLLVTMPGYAGCPDNFDNVAMTYIISLATLNGMDTKHIASYVEVEGDRNQHNPVADWITSKAWDGVARLEDFYATLVHRADFPEELKRTLMRRWALGAVAAALQPHGFHSRGVLTLQGPQSIGKTAWCRALISDETLRRAVIKLDHHLDGNNKDTLITAIAHWIVEIGELDSTFKRDVARLKGFITADNDKLRRPYAKGDSTYQRRTVFCASVNEETFLVDSTGNTRWWTIPVTAVNFQHGIDMQQVFAQLAVEFEFGERWWLTPAEEQMLEAQNSNHRAVSAIRDLLLDKLDLTPAEPSKGKLWSTTEILKKVWIEAPSNGQCKECVAVLRELVGEPSRVNGSLKWRVTFRQSQVEEDTNLY